MSTLDKFGLLLLKRFRLSPQEIASGRTLRSLGIDSLAALDLLFDIDAAFGITLPDAAEQAVTIGEIVGLIDRQLALRAGAPRQVRVTDGIAARPMVDGRD